MDMVERVAKALHKSNDARTDKRFRVAWKNCMPAYREMIREDAIAAIEAMRNPTDEMMNASVRNLIDQYHASKADEPKTFVEELDVEDLWCAAIDSILKSTRETAPAQPVEEK